MLIGRSQIVKEMRQFVNNTSVSNSILIGGEAGTGRTSLIKRICKKAEWHSFDYMHKIIVLDSTTPLDDSFYTLLEDVRFIITESRELFDELQSHIQQSLWINPLRDHIEDIPLLIEHFTTDTTAQEWTSTLSVEKLLSYWWPLNVFELKRVLTSVGGAKYLPWAHKDAFLSGISVTELISLKMQKYWADLEHGRVPGELFSLFLDSVEREFIESALHYCDNSRQRTAQLLDIHRNTLANKIKKLGVTE